eukprot:4975315-Pleurochrysis_carterae.AAC.1
MHPSTCRCASKYPRSRTCTARARSKYGGAASRPHGTRRARTDAVYFALARDDAALSADALRRASALFRPRSLISRVNRRRCEPPNRCLLWVSEGTETRT